jgi:glucose-6-phosphate dehydrogenase assembly protein OpcA
VSSVATSDAFLSGQGIPVGLRDIETELARLWGPAAEREGGPNLERPTVTRVVLSNLVVADFTTDPGRAEGELEELTARYPCRAIVLRPSESASRTVTAEISAACHLPAPGRPQVCAERIVLRAGAEALDLLPGAVLTLLEPDLPVVLWWIGDPRSQGPLFRSLATQSSRVILDLSDPGATADALRAGLDLAVNPYTHDVVWFGLSPWRELCAQFFDGPCASDLANIRDVRIEAASPPHGSPRISPWVVAWLAGVLRWTFLENNLFAQTARFQGPAGAISVAMTIRDASPESSAQILGLSLTMHDGTVYRLSRPSVLSDEICAETNRPGCTPRCHSIQAPPWDAARRLAAGLESARMDEPYRLAVPIFLRLVAATAG